MRWFSKQHARSSNKTSNSSSSLERTQETYSEEGRVQPVLEPDRAVLRDCVLF